MNVKTSLTTISDLKPLARSVAGQLLSVMLLMLSGCVSMVDSTAYPPGHASPDRGRQPPVWDIEQPDRHTPERASAVTKLIQKGRDQRRAGDYAAATATLERALRLESRSVEAYLELAQVKLATHQFEQAVQMAEKALVFIPKDQQANHRFWRRQAWQYIAKARASMGDREGAARAELKAHET